MVRKLLGSLLVLAAFAFCVRGAAADTLPAEVTNVTAPVVETVTGAAGAATAGAEEAPAPPVTPPPAQVGAPADPPSLPADAATGASPAASALPDAVRDTSSQLSPAAADTAGEEATRTVEPDEASQQLPDVRATSTSDASNSASSPGENSSSAPRPVGFAPETWFLANIWPAIALDGGDGFDVLAAVETTVFGRPAAAGSSPSARASEVPAQLDAQPPAFAPGTMTTKSGSTPVQAALSIGVKLALLSGIAALLAFLALTLRREFSSAPGTPGHRRWRAPRA